MQQPTVSPQVFDFLTQLKENNNRPWFNEHKSHYQQAYAEMIEVAEELIRKMNMHDVLEPMTGKQSLFRIYRDVRFSKDKSPYKAHFSGQMKRAGKLRRGGYYFHVQPGGSFIGGGFWGPNSNDLKRIRQEIDVDAEPLRTIINAPDFIKTFGALKGDKVKTAPRGYRKDHPNIDLLRYKQFLLVRDFSDEEVQNPNFIERMNDAFRHMRPFFDYMSEVLTTDINGVPLEDL